MAAGKYHKWLEKENLILLKGWARDGLTMQQIAANIGVSRSTLQKWATEHSDISDALKKNKPIADYQVENSLFERATGGIREVKKHIKCKEVYYDKKGRRCEREKIVAVYDEVYIPGDTTAQIYYLKNRQPDKWRDKRVIQEHPEFESDGFLDALKAQSGTVFNTAEAGDIVET